MSKNVGLWIDHKKAVVVILEEQGEVTRLIQSGVEKQNRVRGGIHAARTKGTQDLPADVHKDKHLIERLNRFYGSVISALRDSDSVLIFGPGEAKSELEKRIAHEKIGARIAGVETADKMTDRQIAAKVRGYFQR